jgi:uncharacterized membrane protein YraQ (UPF0718 family)
MHFVELIGKSLFAAAGMFWLIFWALILGFMISGAVQAFVSKKRMAELLGRSDLKSIALASFFGATSSSCSYAATSMARTLFQKGAHIVPALAFMIASTNLVLELSIVLWTLMGWQFVLAEFVGGGVLILLVAVLMKAFGPLRAFEAKRAELDAEDEMEDDSELPSPMTREGWAIAARSFVSEWKMIWKDVVLGVLISGFLMVFVSDSFWQSLFRGGRIGNALVGPIVSMLSFVCSVGNIPMANVLYHGGIGFGGAIAFIYADLIIIPLILIYRKYYGWKLGLWITGVLYLSMAATGVIIDLLFTALGLIPGGQPMAMGASEGAGFFQLNYTFWLNLIFFALAIGFVVLARSAKEPEHHCCH